ncbi:uncharacterized protein [Montipora capricornis]|uniref:uncharacterized protein isoform X2 n=1 Tax=Montipora capricornis TaxID=246305 RepID=UPI0035F1AA61
MDDTKPNTALHWFRKNLRLHDNPALCEAIKGSACLFAVYILPPVIPDTNISANRWNFLIECLEDLDHSLRSIGSKLLVVQGYPAEIIPKLIECLHITKLTFESESEPFSRQRDAVITHLAESVGVKVVSCTSHTLYDVDGVIKANNNETPKLFDSFLDVVSTLGPPETPVGTVSHDMLASLLPKKNMFEDCRIPSVEDLGIERSKGSCQETWPGGESEALRKLDIFLQEMVDVDFQVDSASEVFLHGFTDRLSPYLRFGCLSPRTYYHALSETYQIARNQKPPLSLFSWLLRRDFHFVLGSNNPTLNQRENNPLCLQINWEENAVAVEKWKMGKTGFPFIDAIMRQLQQEGWIPSLARQIVGSFLTQGCMWISWEEGFKVFGELQLDAEWSLNAGSWLWISGSAFDQNRLPIFCPVETAKKIDPKGEYTRKYVPEVKDLPTDYVFEPWKAPECVQQAAGCLLGTHYPLPVVDHEEQRRVCVHRLKELAESIGESVGVDERGHTSVHLFRKDLRLHDNPTLRACLEDSGTFYPVYVLDTKAARESKISPNRWNFLLECLRDLDNQLAGLGSRLFVVRGRDVEILPKLFAEWGVTRLSFESDIEPFGAQRDSVIRHIAEEAGIEVLSKTSHTLYEPGDILRANRGIAPMVFEDFVGVLKENGLTVPSPVKEVDRQLFGCCVTPVGADHQANFGVPELSDLGVKDIQSVTSAYLWKGGEQEALRRLELLQKELVKNDFEEEPLSGASMSSSATHLSPYLRFGCLSSRVMWQRINDTYWKGKTGFPWIDAVMRQLHEEGWIPHFARQAVGCFLTRGSLWINWEEGYKVFDELQLDAEWSLNVGNWLWLSGGTFVKGHVPWFCPVEVGKKIDPTGEYVRKYVPEVKDIPVEYVFEPWKAPESVQKAAGCLVGKDYPLPVVDHEEQRRVCVQRLKELAESVGESIEVDERGHTSVHLFRKDLRLHDNPTLHACLEDSGTFYPVYVLDTKAARESKISPNRWEFLLECLRDLDNQLAGLGSRLFVVRGRDVEILPKLFEEWGVTRLSFEGDIEPFGAQRDSVIRHIAEEAGIEVLSKTSHTLYEPGDILHANHGIAPMVFEDFVGVLKENGLTVPSPVKEVDRQLFGCCVTPVAADHQANFGVPELSDLGVKDVRLVTSGYLWKGGEQEALRRLVLFEEKLVKNDFENEPLSEASMPSSATHLSPYLRFGCLSPRLMWQRTVDSHWKAKGTMPPISLLEPLLLREFFFVIAITNSGLDKMDSNPFSIQYPWEENPEWLQRWKQGTTGFPWIDAVMRQLRQEGWIPHLARQAVGCFLTRGCLWINWEEGYKVFDELLLDAEWSLNVGNWLWLSGSAFMKGHVPWFCPVEVGKKIDPTGEYVKKYVPEVKRLPLKYLFEPWKAPFKVQQAARCIVGDDYPEPVADHIQQRIICVQRLKDLCISLDILGHRSLHWFRKDLRLHDNPSLRECLRNSRVFYGVFFLPNIEGKQGAVSPNRWEFLLQSLQDLDNNLAECGSRLFVISGNPTKVLPQLFKKWNITRLSFEVDSEPCCNMRDAVICDLAKKDGVEIISSVSHTLYDPRAVSGLNTGNVPLLFDDFKAIVLEQMKPEMPVSRVDRKLFGACVTPVGKDHHQLYGVPKLNDICGFSKSSSICSELYPGGEQEGLKRMETALQEMKKNDFCEPEVTAYSLLPSSRHLSPYLRFGCLSSRLLHQRITEEYIKTKGSNPPPEFYDKLLWREYFFAVGSRVPGAHEMVNNPLSLQIPWEDSDEYLERWKQGMTGFPWIDAIMRQLRSEGWIHDLARRAVGSFLTRGCLWINWEEGFKVFDEFQLDAERSLNSGNWLWLSTSTFVKGHVPWFCPVGVGKKIDPTGEYVRKYVPELRNVPTEFVFEPWLAPLDLQRYCGCVIGRDYPAPIVNHLEQRVICVQRMREMALKLTSF